MKNNTPQLRFPEFKNEWQFEPLDNLAKIDTGNKNTQDQVENGRYPFFVRSNNIEHINSYSYDGVAILTSGDGVGVGKNFHYINGKFGYHQRVYAIKEFSDNINSKFLYQYFADRFYNRVIRMSAKNSVDSIRMDMIAKMHIPCPSIEEQNKIADFLTKVDEKIEKLENKKELFEKFKKGVMQKIFSQKIRFKDENGKNYLDWEEKKLGDIADIYDGTHQTPKYKNSGIPFYSVEQVTANNFSDTKYISEEIYETESKKVQIEKNDILMTKIGDIGTSKYISWNARASFYVSLALIKHSDSYNSIFLDQYIKTNKFQHELWQRTIHVAFPKKINLGEIGNCAIITPAKKEQEKIADFLTLLDNKVELINNQLEQARLFKKFLLQKMFV